MSNGNYSLCARKYMEALHASKKDGYTFTIYVHYIEGRVYLYYLCILYRRTGIPLLFMYILKDGHTFTIYVYYEGRVYLYCLCILYIVYYIYIVYIYIICIYVYRYRYR